MPFGAEVTAEGVRFRVFAPVVDAMRLQMEGASDLLQMHAVGDGWYELRTDAASAGSRYRCVLPDGTSVPDPASRFQPEDVAGASEVIDPEAFAWSDVGWRGRPWHEAVIYELHVGSFTREGTFRAAVERLDHLVELGVTAIELMSLSDFPGTRNWGYDAVLPFAPDSAYGRPEELKRLVDEAHRRSLMVFLDVVYNHFGPEGDYTARYFPQMCSAHHASPWGKAFNFDGPGSHQVREFFIHNALYWMEEFHIDGLRLDASHLMVDEGPKHILEELAERVRGAAAGREVHLILEDQYNVAQRLMRRDDGSAISYTAQWNHDMSHLLSAAFGNVGTGHDPAGEDTQLLAEMLANGYVLPPSASRYPEEVLRRVPPNAYIAYTQTHDLVGNRIDAKRLHALVPPEAQRAATAVMLLLPQTPMLFMGEEWNATALFPFFSDYHDQIGEAVRKGRSDFLKKQLLASDEEVSKAPDPQAESTFRSAQLDWNELGEEPHARVLGRYRDLLRVRREEIVPLMEGMWRSKSEPRMLRTIV